MPIRIPEIISSKGKDDAKRHRDKQREVIKKNLPAIIGNESIITAKKGKIVKIPIKYIDIPHFRPGKTGDGGVGVGQGEGEPGDVIGRKPPCNKPGQPGNQPGENMIETEVEIEEIIEMMLEDLGLPKLEEKQTKELLVEFGYRIRGLSKSGPQVLLEKKRTVQEGIKRFWALLNALQQTTGLSELVCFDALKKANGIMNDAIVLLQEPNFVCESSEVQPFPILENDDLRFRRIEEDVKYKSQAVIIAMMDVSGSMGTEKKYIARSMLFWLVSFLRKIYEHVDVRFIIHHSEAKIVEEELFFKTMESGGTLCYTAYELAGELIDNEYDTSAWNVYVWHFSDGEDFNAFQTAAEIKKLFAKGINMLGYGEIQPEPILRSQLYGNMLMQALKSHFDVQEIKDSAGPEMIIGRQEPLLGVTIEKKEQVLSALKQFLKKERWNVNV